MGNRIWLVVIATVVLYLPGVAIGVTQFEHRFLALAWMEKDLGLGIGSIDTPFLFLAGGATDWLPLAAVEGAPQHVEFGPTWTGGQMSLTIE